MINVRAVQKTEVCPPRQEVEIEQPAFDVNLESVARMYCPVCNQKMNTSSVKALSEGSCPACGEKVVVHGRIGSYRVLRVLGYGGMGVVYEGFDDGLGRKVAIKVTQVDVTKDKEMLATFQREAQVVARLNHPNVVQVYAFGEEKGHPYLVMELLSSGSLMDLIKEEEPIGETFVMGVTYEIAEGLNAAQEAGLLHGDIKPENILFDEKMHAKLVDFGIAAMQVSKTSNEVWGTPYYIAPEKVVDRKSNHKCDIYSLGATLYHAMTKRPPFNGTDPTMVIRAAIDGKARPLSQVRPDVNPEVEAIITRMMEKDTNLRYPNYKSIISDVKKYLSTVPRERLRRTSRIVVSGPRKLKKATQKVMSIKPSSTSTILTSSQPLENEVPGQAGGLLKTFRAKMVLLLGGLSILGGVMVFNHRCYHEDQNALYLQAWSMDKQYAKTFVAMDDSLKDLDEIGQDALGVINILKVKKPEGSNSAVGAGLISDGELECYKKKFDKLIQDSVVLRNQAEMAKLEPSSLEEVDGNQLARLKKGLETQKVYAEEIDKNINEGERLLAEIREKGNVLAPTSTNSQNKVQMIAFPKTKELAGGVGKEAEVVDLAKQEGLKNFQMQEGEYLIIAIWNPQPGMSGGGEIYPLTLTRAEGGKAYIVGHAGSTGMGDFSSKGLFRRTKFPAIEKMEEAKPTANSSNEFHVPSMGVVFRQPKENQVLKMDVAGRRRRNVEQSESAPALVFKMKRDGTYSLVGKLALRSPSPESKIVWMVWTAKAE
jgi:serine/threonine protein kinase